MKDTRPQMRQIRFGGFRLERETEVLYDGETEVHLAKLPFQILLYLIENRQRIVTRHELLETFWEGRDVYDDALRKAVSAVRKALNDVGKPPQFIETVYGRGFRFIGAVETQSEAQKAESVRSAPEPAAQPSRRYVLFSILAVVLVMFVLLGFFVNRPLSNKENQQGANFLQNRSPVGSVAVLPLKNLTGDVSNDYLSDGITESLINELSQIKELKVISRGSTFMFKGKDATPQEIGQKLGVETVLEGGLRRSGEKIRVEVRLVKTSDGSVVWASNYEEKPLKEIFALQDGIVCQLVAELKVKVCGEVAPAARYTANVKAYQLYLQGLAKRNVPTPENLQKAVSFYEEALKIEPDYALAHEGLATVFMLMEFNTESVAPGVLAPKALFHAEKALAQDENLVGAYIVIGAVKSLKNYDLTEREKYYLQALERQPAHRTARLWLSNIYTARGEFERAENEILRVQEIDPLSFGVRLTLAELYMYWGRFDKMAEQAELMLAGDPQGEYANYLLGKAALARNDLEAADAYFAKAPTFSIEKFDLLVKNGRLDEARRIVEKFAVSSAGQKAPYSAAIGFAAVGDKEKTLESLEKAFEIRQANLISMKVQPEFEFLRSDDRFQNLLRRVNL